MKDWVLNLFWNGLYVRFCKYYSYFVVRDRPADGVYKFLISLYFYKLYRRWPDLAHPQTFNERMCHKLLFDRNPILTIAADKFKVRDYIEHKIGKGVLPKLLWHGEDPDSIPYDRLPNEFVVKLNHGSGMNVLVSDKRTADLEKIRQKLKLWLKQNYCYRHPSLGHEWCYRNIRPVIVIEEFLGSNRVPPDDYKFFCFHGKAEYLEIDFDRFGDHTSTIYDRNFSVIDVDINYAKYPEMLPRGLVDFKRPPNYDELVAVADKASEDFDFVRVDLYTVGDKIYFGELTNYPAGGALSFEPERFDRVFGAKW